MKIDYTVVALGAGAGYLLLTKGGQKFLRDGIDNLKALAPAKTADPAAPAAGAAAALPGSPAAVAVAAAANITTATGTTAAATTVRAVAQAASLAAGGLYERYRAPLPTGPTDNSQIWVRELSSGRWIYVNDPSQFGRYGIDAGATNLITVPWGGSHVFNAGAGLPADAQWWTNSPTATGINAGYPQVPWNNTQALRAAYAAGQLVPVNVTGYAVLKQQGAI